MTDEQRVAKTRSLGVLPIEKAKLVKGWDAYAKATAAHAKARADAETTKEAVRAELKHRLGEQGDLDFAADSNRIRMWENLRVKKVRALANDRSADFTATKK